MAQNGISLAAARGNFLTWCISGSLPLASLCRPLYIAAQLDGAEGVPGEAYVIYSVNEARSKFGAGSIAALMAQQHFDCCPELPLYIAPVNAAAGVAAINTLTITGPATDNGALSVAILDKVYAVGVITGATADSMATALAADMNADADLPYAVTAAAGVVTLTAKNKGVDGNWFVPVFNPNFGDAFPAGVTVVAATPTPGSGIIDINP